MLRRYRPSLPPRALRTSAELRRLGKSLFITLCAAQISACAWIHEEERFTDEDPALALVETYPAKSALGVVPATHIDFCFSGPIDPTSAGAFDGLLVSGDNIFDAEVALQLFPWTPPGGIGALPETSWCPGSVLSVRPRGDLRPDIDYRVRLRPFVVGWGGEALDLLDGAWEQLEDGRWVTYVEFHVAPESPENPVPDEGSPPTPPITLSDLYDAGGPFDPARNLCSCHGVDGELAQARLDLSTPQLAFEGLVLDTTPASTGFARVAPTRPSESFLIQKLLRDAEGAPLHAVRGSAMPPDEPIPYRDLVMIARWIEDGALP